MPLSRLNLNVYVGTAAPGCPVGSKSLRLPLAEKLTPVDCRYVSHKAGLAPADSQGGCPHML